MKYAIVNFNDHLFFKIEGFGLMPVTFLYKELSELYIKRLESSSNYTLSTIRDLELEELETSKETEKFYEEKRKYEAEIFRFMDEQNIPRKLAVLQVGEQEGNSVLRELTTGATLYMPTNLFLKHEVTADVAKNHALFIRPQQLSALVAHTKSNTKKLGGN